MKYVLFVLLIFIISCSSTKLVKEVDSKNDNIFVELCSLENSKGLTIDNYFKNNEFDENEVITNFFSDESYMGSVKELMMTFKSNSDADNSREKMNEMIESASVDYPRCISIFPMFMSVAGNTMN
jgi:hypothetical protein